MAARERLMGTAAADAVRIPHAADFGLADLRTRSGSGAGAQRRFAFFFARPIVASVIVIGREGAPVGPRARQDLMTDGIGMCLHIGPGLVARIGWSAAAGALLAQLVEHHLRLEFVLVAMKIFDVLGDHHAGGVVPGALADAVARVDG